MEELVSLSVNINEINIELLNEYILYNATFWVKFQVSAYTTAIKVLGLEQYSCGVFFLIGGWG